MIKSKPCILADRIVVLNGGQIEQVGTPLELYHTPANLFVAGFIGSPKMNLIASTVANVVNGAAQLMLNGGSTLNVHREKLTPGEKITVGIRPEHIVISPEGSIQGRVELVEHLGGEVIAYLTIGEGQPLTVKFTHEVAVNVGDNLRLAVREPQVSVFDAKGVALASAPVSAPVSTFVQ